MANFSDAQFRQLLETISSGCKRGSFAQCNYTYDGDKNSEVLEAFLSAVDVYKRIENVSDEDALTGLPLILKNEAGLWWQGIKDQTKTWLEFKVKIRHAFAPKKPAYLVYQEIMNEKQEVDQLTERFIARKRMLFTLLPGPEHTETQKIDMIYGLVRLDIRSAVPRSAIDNFDQLIEAARGVENYLEEKRRSKPSTSNFQSHQQRPGKLRCSFCRLPGHTVDVCRKRKKLEALQEPQPSRVPVAAHTSESTTQMPSPSQPKFACYGCGAPGVIRSNCLTCSGKNKTPKLEKISFCAVNVQTDTRSRPVVFISIDDIVGVAHIDTCAKTSVASYQLYCCLKARGYKFQTTTVDVILADGVPKPQAILTVNVYVVLCGYRILTNFIVLPESRDNKTLLGIGFIQDAKMMLNLPQFTWYSLENPNVEYELYSEDIATIGNTVELNEFGLPSPITPLMNTPKESNTSVPVKKDEPMIGATAITSTANTLTTITATTSANTHTHLKMWLSCRWRVRVRHFTQL